MKRLIFFLGILLTFSTLTAQKKVIKNNSSKGINEVFIHAKFANTIEIKQWNKKEISVTATVNIDNNQHNDYFSLTSDKIGSTYTVKSDYGNYFKKYRNYYRKGKRTRIKNDDDEDSECDCKEYTMEIAYVIYVPKEMSLRVKSISGNAKIDSYTGFLELDLVSGDIDVKKHSKSMYLKTVSGDIDLYIGDATFNAKTLTGSIYSDLNIDFEKQRKKSYSHSINATIKKGTAKLTLNTVSGDIFLRKS